jgi:hypothetical protein
MSTSANVIEYSIYKDGENVGNFRKHMLCRLPDYADLLKYQPLDQHTIQAWGYDEEDDEWEDEEVNLDTFLKGMVRYNKKIKEYYETLL